MSLRLENLAGMVCPNEPIGPDGSGSFEADEPCPLTDADGASGRPVGNGRASGRREPFRAAGSVLRFALRFWRILNLRLLGGCRARRSGAARGRPADGCREMGWTSAARASSGVGILSTSVDCRLRRDGTDLTGAGIYRAFRLVARRRQRRANTTGRRRQRQTSLKNDANFSWKPPSAVVRQRPKGGAGCMSPRGADIDPR